MTKEEAEAIIADITLAHMDVPIDIDKLMLSDYPERPLDFYLLGVQAYFRKWKEMLAGDHKLGLIKRALAYAKRDALAQLIVHWDGVIDAAKIVAMSEAETSGWYREDWFSYNHVTDLINSFLTDEDLSIAEASNWRNVVENILPQAKKFEVPTYMLMRATMYRKKFRTAVPALNHIVAEIEYKRITPEFGKKMFMGLLDAIGDPNVTVSKIDEAQKRLRGAITVPPPIIPGTIYIMPYEANAQYWIVIPCDERSKSRIEQMLTSLVDLKIAMPNELKATLNQLIRKELSTKLQLEGSDNGRTERTTESVLPEDGVGA